MDSRGGPPGVPSSTRASSPERPRWRRLRLGLLLLVLLIVSLRALGHKEEYCRYCGMRRSSLCLFPLMVADGPVGLWSTCVQTAFSRVLVPILPRGQCSHQWVLLREHAALCSPHFMSCGVGYHGTDRERALRALELFAAGALRTVGQRDSELACAMARTLLFPYAEWSDHEHYKRQFFLATATPIRFLDDRAMAKMRALYGLPAEPE